MTMSYISAICLLQPPVGRKFYACSSRYQKDLAHRLALFECRLRSGCLCQRVLTMHVDLELTTPDPCKDIARAFFEFRARRCIGAEVHPREIETALGAEQTRVNRRNGAT